MKKTNFVARTIFFLFLYLFIYFSLIFSVRFAAHMPRLIGNFSLSFPQLMFPFNILFWGNTPIITNNSIVFLVSGFYLVILSSLFAYVVRPVKKKQWIILFAICFIILSVIVLNCFFRVCGITVETRMP